MRYPLAFLLVLAGCTPSTPSDDASWPGTPPVDRAPTVQTSTDRMPEALLGTFDTDGPACTERLTMSRLVVSPDTLDFYYGYATVDSVRTRGEGYVVEATLYHLEGVIEVVPEPIAYRVEPTDEGLRLETDYAEGSELVRSPAGRVQRSPEDPGGDAQSAYTKIDDCETIETFEEGGGSVQRCTGYEATPLYVSEGDLRVDAGVRNDRWETPGGFNTLGETVEWRVRGGRPFAAIVRYEVEGPGGTPAERRSDLAVIKVGTDGSPGCLVGYVPADAAPGQNVAARRLADREAASYDCEG